MIQLPVTKRGRYQATTYNDRIATFDSQQQCIFLSRNNHPEEMCHHKLFVQEVSLWPKYREEFFNELYSGREAMLTVKVGGYEVPTTRQDKMRVRGCAQKGSAKNFNVYFPDRNAAPLPLDRALNSTSSTHTSEGAFPSSTTSPVSAAGVDDSSSMPPPVRPARLVTELGAKRRYWTFRCSSVYALEQLVRAFHTLQPPSPRAEAATVFAGQPEAARRSSVVPRIVGSLGEVHTALEKEEPANLDGLHADLKF